MSKQEIIKIFLKKGILSNKTDLVRRPFNWKSKFDDEAQEIFNQFAMQYRSEAEAWFCLCRDIELPVCPICNKKKVKFTGNTKYGAVGYNTTCEDCSANAIPAKKEKYSKSMKLRTDEARKQTNLKRRMTNKIRYGDENYTLFGSKSFKQNLKDKYGDEHFNNKELCRKTCIDRYGVTTNLLIPEVHKKNVENSWSDECRQRRIEKCMRLYGVSNLLCLKSMQDKMQRIKTENIKKIEHEHDCTMISTVCKMYGQGFKVLGLEYLYIANHVFVQNKDLPTIERYFNEGRHTNGYTSKLEKDVLAYVKSIYNGLIEENTTSIVLNENYRFFELDIYLPRIKLAIDVNGTYWHSTAYKDVYYHQRKTRCCRNCGVNLLHVFEDDWKDNNALCKQTIESCINCTFNNVIRTHDDGIIIGDNSKPVFGDYEIVSITDPIKHISNQLEYYDSGEIAYKFKKIKDSK